MSKEVDAHWDDPKVESQYDKNLMWLESRLITRQLPTDGKILDAGCGEGEGTHCYAIMNPRTHVVGLDRSPTRLKLATEGMRARGVLRDNMSFVQSSVTKMPFTNDTFNAVVSQRCLINLLTDEERQAAVEELVRVCKNGCSIICLEGSVEGNAGLNHTRSKHGLPPIDVKFHNRFFTEDEITKLFSDAGAELDYSRGLGGYLYLTRVVKPAVCAEAGAEVSWNTDFNVIASEEDFYGNISKHDCDRLKMWVFTKIY